MAAPPAGFIACPHTHLPYGVELAKAHKRVQSGRGLNELTAREPVRGGGCMDSANPAVRQPGSQVLDTHAEIQVHVTHGVRSMVGCLREVAGMSEGCKQVCAGEGTGALMLFQRSRRLPRACGEVCARDVPSVGFDGARE